MIKNVFKGFLSILYMLTFSVFPGTAFSADLTPGTEGWYNHFTSCENNTHLFKVEKDEGFGRFSFAGKVVMEEGQVPFEDERVTTLYVRMKVDMSKSMQKRNKAYKYFSNLAKTGNTINTYANEVLYFSLGEMHELNEKFDTTANISPQTEKKILNAIKSGKKIRLTFKKPLYEGMGVGANFSYACSMQ